MTNNASLEDQTCVQAFSLKKGFRPPEPTFRDDLMNTVEPSTNSDETQHSAKYRHSESSSDEEVLQDINEEIAMKNDLNKSRVAAITEKKINKKDDEKEQYIFLHQASEPGQPSAKESMNQDWHDNQIPPQQIKESTDAAGHPSVIRKRLGEKQEELRKKQKELDKEKEEVSKLQKILNKQELDVRTSENQNDVKLTEAPSRSMYMYMFYMVLVVLLIIILAICLKYRFPGEDLTVFVTGKAGSGKTSLIYGLLGVDKEEMERKRKIAAVITRTGNVTRNGVRTTILERSLLEQDDSGMDSDEVYRVQNVDLVLYTLRMDDGICRPSHKIGLQKLGSHFGKNIWNKTVIALTFANRVDYVDKKGNQEISKKYLEERKFYWIRCIYEVFFEEEIPEIIRKEIPIVPVGYYTKPKLFGDSWIDVLTRSILSRLADSRAQKNLKLAFNVNN